MPEKTNRGPSTNKNISVRNMKAQISNMSLNENAGFKSEYHVSYILLTCFILLIFIINTEFVEMKKIFVSITFTLQDIPRGELHPCLEGKKPKNKVKNRYTTTYPCMYKTFKLA